MKLLKPTPLYAFEWNEGGFNQVYAPTKRAAIAKAKLAFASCNLTPNEGTFRALRTREAQSAYWKNLPLMD